MREWIFPVALLLNASTTAAFYGCVTKAPAGLLKGTYIGGRSQTSCSKHQQTKVSFISKRSSNKNGSGWCRGGRHQPPFSGLPGHVVCRGSNRNMFYSSLDDDSAGSGYDHVSGGGMRDLRRQSWWYQPQCILGRRRRGAEERLSMDDDDVASFRRRSVTVLQAQKEDRQTQPFGSSLALSSVLLRPEVLRASMGAVTELMTCCWIGVYAASQKILDPAAVSSLSKIVYNIFLPSLLMTNVAKTVTSQPAASLIPIPIMAGIQISIGLLLSKVTNKLFNIDPDSEEGREATVSSAFGNSGLLPFVFAGSLFRHHPDPTMLPRAIAYVSFFLMGWSPTFWTLGFRILTDRNGKNNKKAEVVAPAEDDYTPSEQVARFRRFVNVIIATVREVVKVPTAACFVGLFIGLFKPARRLLMGDSAPLAFVWNAFTLIATAYTPAGILVLAGSLANGPKQSLWTKSTLKKLVAVVVNRWMLLPTMTAGLLWAGLKLSLLPHDNLLLFVFLMESCMPSAQNAVVILQVAGMQEMAGKMARSLCLIYVIGILPVSMWLTYALHVLKLV